MSNPITFTRDDNGFWYTENEGEFPVFHIKTDRNYGRGESNITGKEYYILYTPIDPEASGPTDKIFNLYPILNNTYKDDNGEIRFVPWDENYGTNIPMLPEVNAYPKTGTIVLETYYPFSDGYLPGHSMLDFIPDYSGNYRDYRYVDIHSSDKNYNLFTNNCVDGTSPVVSAVTGIQYNPWIKTPWGLKLALKDAGYREYPDGRMYIRVNNNEEYDRMVEAFDRVYKNFGIKENY